MLRKLGFAALRLLCVMLLASFAGAVLLRVAPGFSSDEQELTPGLSAQSVQAIRDTRMADSNIPRFYARYLRSLLHGDLGVSQSLNQPVSTLLRERVPVTARNLGFALLAGWVLALGLALASQLARTRWFAFVADGLSSSFISTPAAVLALIFVILRWPAMLAAALLIFPKVYSYARNLLDESSRMPHVFAAQSRGAGRLRTLICHVAPIALPQLVALLGVSISLGLGVLLPIEVICDIAGVGQLAWQAAQSRDLALLVNLTLIVSFVTVCATMLSDAFRSEPAGSTA